MLMKAVNFPAGTYVLMALSAGVHHPESIPATNAAEVLPAHTPGPKHYTLGPETSST
jgi:hypothetical protein